MNKQSKEREKKLTELGTKSRAGTLMTTLFRAVASEMTELIAVKVPGNKDGKMKTLLVSKAEAIVRDIVEKALPHKLADGEICDAKEQLEYRKLLMDRVDGRVGTVDAADGKSGTSIPNKVSEVSKSFLNDIAVKKKKKTAPPEM